MKITFLGTAASYPTATRSLPAIAVQRRGELLLFDCGEGTQRQMVLSKIRFSNKMKILITHMHGDHVLGLPGILQSMSLFNRKETVTLYGPSGLYDFVKSIKETVKFSLTFPIKVREIKEGVVCREEDYTIKARWVEHTIPTLAYALIEKKRLGIFNIEKAKKLNIPRGPLWSKLQHEGKIMLPDGRIINSNQVMGLPRRGRKVVYSGDTRSCEALLEIAKDADVLIHEATFSDNLSDKAYKMYHSTPSQSAKIAKEAHVKSLILTHIGGRYIESSELLSQARNIFSTIDIAKDLMKVEVPYGD